MGHIGTRIKELRQQLGLSQTEFARRIQLTQPSLSNIESGVTSPSWDTVQAVHAAFGVSFDWLAGAAQHVAPANAVLTPAEAAPKAARIPLLDQSVMAGYFAGSADPDFSREPRYLVHPDFPRGIAVEVTGNSMEPTIRPRDILICTPVETIDEQFDDNYIYVVVTAEGALVKRVVNRSAADATLVLTSDNREYAVQTLPLREVLQLYRVRRRITANLSGPERLNERLWELERQLSDLSRSYQLLETRLDRAP